MRATDGLQTAITLGPVNGDGQTIWLELSLYMSLPMPSQDEHLPDQIEASVHQAGLDIQRQLFKVLMEKADQELVLERRHGKGDAGMSAEEHAPSPSRRSSAMFPFSGRESATSTTTQWRYRRRSPGTHLTNCTSPRTSATTSMIR